MAQPLVDDYDYQDGEDGDGQEEIEDIDDAWDFPHKADGVKIQKSDGDGAKFSEYTPSSAHLHPHGHLLQSSCSVSKKSGGGRVDFKPRNSVYSL